MKSRLARAGVVGAMAVGAVVAVTTFGAPGGAQADATSSIENPGFDSGPDVSDDGRIIVFASAPEADGSGSTLYLHDRGAPTEDGTVSPATTTLIPDSLGAVKPSISGNGCFVTWSAVTEVTEPEPAPTTEVTPTDPVDTSGDSAPADSDASGDALVDDSGEPADDASAIEPAVATLVETPEPDGDEPGIVDSDALQSAPARVVVLDRCTDPAEPAGVRVDLPLQDDDLSFGPAAVSLDGSVIAVSNGTDVIRFAQTTGQGYTETARFDGGDTDAEDHLVAERVDVSDDGSVVVFSGGLDLADTALMTVFAHVVDGATVLTTPVLTAATDPTVSGDGTLVVGSTGADGSSVVLVDRMVTPLVPVDLGPGRRPAISADGNHVVLEEGANLAVVSRTGQGDAPFATTQRTLLSSTITPTRSGPVIDRFGTTVVSDREFDVQSPPEGTDISVTVLVADASFDAAMFDLGTGNIDTVLSSTITFSNRGPSSVGVNSIDVDGTFTIVDDRCGAVVRPGTTCGVDISFRVERLEDAFGVVTLTPTSFGVAAFTTQVAALGEAPVVSTSTTSTTTPGSTTGGGSTGGTTGSTRGSTTGSTRGSTTGSTRGSSSTGGSSTSGTGGTATTTTLAPGAGVTASPATFDFAPTIIDAGRRTGLVEVVNNGSGAVNVVGVRLDPAEAGPFQIVETTCADESVAIGARCGVTLSFAPTATGAQSVSLVASLEGGTDIIVPVAGIGAPAPTISVIPGVATVGQVVTLSGAGFPTGITVDVTWGATDLQVVVDDVGTFNIPVVVMANTRIGPAMVSVEGQTDLFGTATGTMLVTNTSDRSGPSILDGIGPNIGR